MTYYSQVKYMFRENLPLAKQKFFEAVSNKENFRRMPHSAEAQAMLAIFVRDTLASYGDVGIFDPDQLAEIDFLTHPEELIKLVTQSQDRQSRAEAEIGYMALMTAITAKWMQHMMDQKFPPLAPHHTQVETAYRGRTTTPPPPRNHIAIT